MKSNGQYGIETTNPIIYVINSGYVVDSNSVRSKHSVLLPIGVFALSDDEGSFTSVNNAQSLKNATMRVCASRRTKMSQADYSPCKQFELAVNGQNLGDHTWISTNQEPHSVTFLFTTTIREAGQNARKLSQTSSTSGAHGTGNAVETYS